MKLFVTGGAGFIGYNFIKRWQQRHPNDEIVNFDVLTYAANRDDLPLLERPGYRFIEGDIADPVAVRAAMEGCDTVVHFAAETHVDRSISGPAAFLRTNVQGTLVLLETAKELGVQRFHHVSTDEVFGALPLDPEVKFHEDTAYDPRSPYSASKAASDHLVRAYYHTYGLPVTISNCTNNYGPYQYPEKLIPVLTLKALRGEPLPIYGDGKYVRDWIHVDDHNAGVEAILERGKVGETYCLGGNAERTNLEVAAAVLATLERPADQLTFVQDRPGHDRRYAMDTSKAARELGWQPTHTFEEGIAETVRWYAERFAAGAITSPDEQGVHA